jgi:hypothetical protein
MRTPSGQGTLSAMSCERRTRLTLELDVQANPVTGVVHDSSGSEPFVGWIALTRAIELALERAASPTPGGTSHPAAGLP